MHGLADMGVAPLTMLAISGVSAAVGVTMKWFARR